MSATAAANGHFPRELRQAALLYLERFMLPIPVRSRGKDPINEGWQNLRPRSEEIDTLFSHGADGNLGLLLGKPSNGLVDVDLDANEAIYAGQSFLPRTGCISGRESKLCSHYWYIADDPPDLAAETYKDLDGTMLVELRSTGGHTVAPPSIHESGERIDWHAFGNPAQISIHELRIAVRTIAAVAILARHWPARGSRQDAAMALAGGLARAAWDEERISTFIRCVAQAAHDDEVAKRLTPIKSTLKKLELDSKVSGWPSLIKLLGPHGEAVVRRVREWLDLLKAPTTAPTTKVRKQVVPPQPYRPFPVQTLPEPAAAYVGQGAAAIGCDPAYLALPMLSVLAGLIGNTRSIRLKRDWYEPSVMWTGTVGDSGTMKSPAQKAVVNYLFMLQRRMIEEFQEKRQQYEHDKAAYEREKKKREKEGKSLSDLEIPKEPFCQRLVCSDVTVERLAMILQDNPRGLLVSWDELGGWLKSFNQYKSKGGSDLASWLAMHRAEPLTIDRKTGERQLVYVPHAAVSITGGIQPGALSRAMTPEYLEAGLGARVAMAMPPKRRKCWSEAEIHPDTKEAYEKCLRDLIALQMDKDNEANPIPFAVRLSPEAKEVWVEWH